jgi:CHAD domain-containing protein
MWAQEVAVALSKAEDTLAAMDPNEKETAEMLKKMTIRLRTVLHKIWKKPTSDVFTAEYVHFAAFKISLIVLLLQI